MDRDSKFTQIKVTRMGGIDQRTSPDDLDAEGRPNFSTLEGLYPSQDGLLSRIPGKYLLTSLPGQKILRIFQPFDSTGNILVQTNQNLYAFTLDELESRTYIPTITASSGAEDEGMSMAILSDLKANNTDGGTLDQVDAAGAGVVDTFYTRVINTEESDPGGIVSIAANVFTLGIGTYRIRVQCVWNPVDAGANIVGTTIGLWNNTDSLFQTYITSAEPIIGTAGKASTATNTEGGNQIITIDAAFTIAGIKAFKIKQKASVQTAVRGGFFCGVDDQCVTNLNVNGAKSKNRYLIITIWKEP